MIRFSDLLERLAVLVLMLIAIPMTIKVLELSLEGRSFDPQSYAAGTQENVVGIYPNEMTESPSDFFVATKDNGVFYVEVKEEKGEYTHVTTAINGNETLKSMNQASIDLANSKELAKANRPRTQYLLMPMYSY